ncbi:MAG: DUF192 domain-containing protein [Egibacteraceae bacterium]
MPGHWLARDGQVLAPLELATTARARSRGLLGRDGIEGAMLLRPACCVHSFGMRFDLDVAFLDRHGVVLRTTRLPRNRMTAVVPRARGVVEAQAGTFVAWKLGVGDRLAVEPPP